MVQYDTTIPFAVLDGLCLTLVPTLYFYRERQHGHSLAAGSERLEKGDVKHIVGLPDCPVEFKAVGLYLYLVSDLERFAILLVEFLAWPSGAEFFLTAI
jgi:hypothetical protein